MHSIHLIACNRHAIASHLHILSTGGERPFPEKVEKSWRSPEIQPFWGVGDCGLSVHGHHSDPGRDLLHAQRMGFGQGRQRSIGMPQIINASDPARLRAGAADHDIA